MSASDPVPEQPSEVLLYRTDDGSFRLDVPTDGETVRLSQQQMAALFGKARSTIAGHIKNVFEEGELVEEVVCRDFRHTTPHGALVGKTQTQEVRHYNLDVIISVGYRVKSLRGTQFRIWATQRLREYLIKGFTMDDQRLTEFKTFRRRNGPQWERSGHRGRRSIFIFPQIFSPPQCIG